MTESNTASQRQVPFPITNPARIPAKRYYDEDFFQMEVDHLWPHVWQLACRLEQIPKVGDWIEYANLGKSVIIVRTRGGVKAYRNACRHRGVPIAGGDGKGHGNCAATGFICPFHGWRWNMDGKNTFVYSRQMFGEEQLDPDDIALRPCRVEFWGGCAFINFDDDAPPLRDCLGPIADRLEKYGVDRLRAEWCYATVLPANWKVAMEAFMEGFHTARTHPQLQKSAPAVFHALYGQNTHGIGVPVNVNATAHENIRDQFRLMELLSEGMAGMCHAKDVETARGLLDVDLPEDPGEAVMAWYGMLNAEVTKQGRARGEATPDFNELMATEPLKGVEFLFPHYFLLPYLSSFSAYRVRPLSPTSCLFELWSLTQFPEGEEPEPVMEAIMLPHDSAEFPPIPRQDYANIPIQQIGLASDGFEFMRLAKDVEGLISNYQQVIDGFLKGAPADRLAAATASLGGNFDGPIRNVDV